MKKILGIILARGGSKGIKNKNIKLINGKPLIYWTIKSAMKSKKLSKVILSTDSKKIASIGKKYNLDVPFIRPRKLAKDNTPSVDAIEHALNFLKKSGEEFEFVVLLEPTSPLRSVQDIDKSIRKIIMSNADSLVSICRTDALNPLFLFKRKKSFLKPFKTSKKKYLRRQDLEPTYFIEGTIYISKVKSLLKKRTFCHNNTIGYEVPKWKSIEIDDNFDWMVVDRIFKNKWIKKNG